MFASTCTACGERRLVFTSLIENVVNTPDGIEMHWTDWCGSAQVHVTGARRTPVAA